MAIKLYEVNPNYIDYLIPYAPHLFHNKQCGQHNERKYIGIVLEVNSMKYFAPLSFFKAKHEKMKNGLDFLKVGNSCQQNYRIIRKMQDKIRKHAAEVYKHKINDGCTTALAKRCNDFLLLEEKCSQFEAQIMQK